MIVTNGNRCFLSMLIVSLTLSIFVFRGDVRAQSLKEKNQAGSVAVLPDGLFVKESMKNALGVKDAKEKTKQGEDVVLFGRIGGRPVPFVEGRAIFLLADQTLPPCSCGCPTPWDLCCSPPEQIMPGLATVQVQGPDGRPLRASLQNVNGLIPLAEVVVEGRVAKRDLNVLVVNADRIYVKPMGN